MISKEGQRALIAYVHYLRVASIGDQGRHQAYGSFGIVGTATLPQQRGLLFNRRVGIHLQQLALDLSDLLRPGWPLSLLIDDVIMFIEVAQIVGRPYPETAQQLRAEGRNAPPTRRAEVASSSGS